jgi:hypothetical protein
MNKILIGSLIGVILICISCSTIPQTTEMSIRQLLKDSPTEGGAIILPNTKINITSPIVISRSNITLVGDTNTVFLLSSNMNCPVIVIGVQGAPAVTNVILMNIQIDGNRTNQSKELWKYSKLGYPMYNNGIIVQNATDILINDIVVSGCISGGLVSTFHVSELVVSNFVAFNNQFDGLACYQTTNSSFLNLLIFKNLAAGISLDLNFNDNIFYNVLLASNIIGIFIRNSNGNVFDDVRMIGNKRFDVFMASVNNKTNTGCINNEFTIKGDGEIHSKDPLCVSNIFKRKLGN